MIRKIALVGGPILVSALLIWGGLPLTNRETNPTIPGGSALAQAQGDTAGSSEEKVVETYEFRFSPSTLTVTPGTRVTWFNKGQAVHAVTSFDRSWDSGPIAPGDRWSFTFAQPGNFPYYCHPGMEGRVVVGDVPEGNVPAPETPESRDSSRGWVSPPGGSTPASFDDMATIMDRMMGPGSFQGMGGSMGGMMGGGMMGGFAPASPNGTAPGNQGWGGMMGSGGMMGGSTPGYPNSAAPDNGGWGGMMGGSASPLPNNGWRIFEGLRGLGGMMGGGGFSR